MKVIRRDEKAKVLRFKVESARDLWFASKLVTPQDIARGTAERKVKIGGEDARNQKAVKKKVTISIKVEKASLDEGIFRVVGTITDAPEGIPRGEHQAINVDIGSELEVVKDEWSPLIDGYLSEAKQSGKASLVVLFDREEALFARLDEKGPEVLFTVQGAVAKKDQTGQEHGNFFSELARKLEEVVSREDFEQIITASPAFWKEYLLEELNPDVAKRVISTTCSEVSTAALSEVVRKPELKKNLEADATSREEAAVEKILEGVSKDGAAYGIVEVEEKSLRGGLKNLVTTETFIEKNQKDDTIDRINTILNAVKQAGGNVIILRTAAKAKIDGLGGIAGLTRW